MGTAGQLRDNRIWNLLSVLACAGTDFFITRKANMSQIQIHNLTFAYEGQEEPVFENADVTLDTDWKQGLIGRNGKGKTTFLRILNGELPYQGTITGRIPTDRFPYPLTQADAEKTGSELLPVWKPGAEEWQVLKEMPDLALDAALLYQPIGRLSQGEKSKLMLAVLFAEENAFLLIDEPTNHLDAGARESIREYLAKKKGFLLVSHDRDLLDACTDHVLALERKSLTQESGNFSTWWENKTRRDAFARSENEKHRREIGRLQKTAARVSGWADQSERYKIGYDPVRDNNHPMRDCIGAKTKKLEPRRGLSPGGLRKTSGRRRAFSTTSKRRRPCTLRCLPQRRSACSL